MDRSTKSPSILEMITGKHARFGISVGLGALFTIENDSYLEPPAIPLNVSVTPVEEDPAFIIKWESHEPDVTFRVRIIKKETHRLYCIRRALFNRVCLTSLS